MQHSVLSSQQNCSKQEGNSKTQETESKRQEGKSMQYEAGSVKHEARKEQKVDWRGRKQIRIVSRPQKTYVHSAM